MAGDGADRPALDPSVVTALLDELGPERTREIWEVFVQDGREKLTALQAALADGDAQGAARAAHGLKSGSGFVGATAVFHLCAEIERTAAVGALDVARTHVEELRARLAQTEEELARRHG